MTFCGNPFLFATNVAMFARNRYSGDFPDAASEFFGDSNTAVFATCTSYCDGGVPFILTGVAAQRCTQHKNQTVEVLFDVSLPKDER
jgi:hypothetical protein